MSVYSRYFYLDNVIASHFMLMLLSNFCFSAMISPMDRYVHKIKTSSNCEHCMHWPSPLVLCAEVDKAESAPMNSLYELFEEFGIFFLSQYHKQFWGLYRQ